MNARVRAPEFRARGWLNTGGKDLKLADVRGKLVILDFWTFCCINCLHVLDELRPLEEKYGDVLVVIGVHSPKFEHERDPAALAAAVERYGVHHPVLDDADMVMWQQYAAKAWPTLSVIDPEGYVVASMAGEGHAEGLMRLLDELIATHEAKGTLRRGDGPYVPPAADQTLLRFPGKAIELPNGNLLVSDSARHSLAELTPDGESLVRRIGSGERGRADGPAAVASFSEPQGLCLLPDGRTVVVADTVNHLLRGFDLESGEVTTLAGTGRAWRSAEDDGVSLSSPWDLAWFEGRVVIAMAGIHQLWWFDPEQGTTGVYAGTTVESLRDGVLPDVWMAQPSGLSSYGTKLWIADSETSALRWVEDGELHTAVGQGLFDFGHVDGAAKEALLQHPLGVAALPDGSVLIADTYNGAVRRFDPESDEVSTVDSGLAEPSDVLVTRSGEVFVVESAAHRLVRLAPGAVTTVEGERQRTERPASPLAPGAVTLDVVFTPPPGQKLDTSFGPSTRLVVSASPPELLLEGEGTGTELSRQLVLNPAVSKGVLQVVAQAATCDADVEHAACHLTRQDWGVPVVLDPSAPDRLPLILRGLDA
ncbi:NHL domain-containing thioredoxin family protein [Actinoplanes sp. N902-109]|uniref:NHL domain-containing thioredoxin family protein n=1 Tax=Actinoplanes sp. (strain N902-109) TaxID=649831 RepID=UPI000329429C|nr:NHL domain-containing thioredoxin family protein [Actinoplanes sp. N902-109]AGL13599.1 alkyl hydroperoxide reductase/ thiol specific antioxidant/ mal allergen [Actinoplanes sp. N902-109]